MTLCFTTFRKTFLSSNSWKNPSWKATSPIASSYFQILLDVVLDVTPILSDMRAFERVDVTSVVANAQKELGTGCRYLQTILGIIDRMEAWYGALATSQAPKQLYSSRPALRSRPPHTQGNRFSYSYTFPDFSVASPVSFFDAIRIKLLGLVGNI